MNDYLAVAAGLACAAAGGELFLRGVVGLAGWARMAPGLVAATVAAFATSSPELSVSIGSALAGRPQIALGDALGSNVFNVALILALALAISGMRCTRESLRRDFPAALAAPVIAAVLLADGRLSRLDGALMLGLFLLWLGLTARAALRQRHAAAELSGLTGLGGWRVLIACVLGMSFLMAAGSLIVAGASGIALAFDVDPFVIGATVVAIGTSMPELVTTLMATLRGHADVSLGTILGSNIFNGLFIVPVAAVIHPIDAGLGEVVAVLAFGLLAMLLTWPRRDGWLGRGRGSALLAVYGAYIAAILYQAA